MPHKDLVYFSVAVSLLGNAVIPAVAQQVSITEMPPSVTSQRPVSAADRAAARRHIVRGDALEAQGSYWSVVAEEYRNALVRDPTSAEAHYKLANTLHDAGQVDACILEYQKVIHLDMPDPAGPAHTPSQTADAYRQLGTIRQDKNQLISAVANFRASLKLEPNNALTHANLARVLADRELYSSAAAEYRTALRLDPQGSYLSLSGIHNGLGNCDDKLKLYGPAVTEYRTAVRLSPNDYAPHSNLAAELDILKRYPEAVRECREAIRLNPSDAQNHNNLGVFLYHNGQHEEARIEWRKVLRMGSADEADAAREELAEYGP